MNMDQNWVRRPDDGFSDLARSIVLKLLQCLGLQVSFLRGAGGHQVVDVRLSASGPERTYGRTAATFGSVLW